MAEKEKKSTRTRRLPSVGELALRQNVIVAAGGYIPLLTETHRPIVV